MSRGYETAWRKSHGGPGVRWAAVLRVGRCRGTALAGLAVTGALLGVVSSVSASPSRAPSAVVLELELPTPPSARDFSVLATQARRTPRLGRSWGPDQAGYGKVRPTRIFNGGDPTGSVEHVHWSGWGGSQAIGEGEAEYVWPGTSVASNAPTSGARVVAFHLGTCRGHASYNAIEWYFPKYGQTFNPNSYIDICAGRYVGTVQPQTACPDVPLTDKAGMATEVKVIHMTCAVASPIIAETNTMRFGAGEGRFTQAGFRCGTEGTLTGLPNALFDCQMGEQEFLYSAKT
ncbi:MAG TPA: hypothetical protein VK701_08785 [Solirubrobacteraceae bacterium]|nr:hypothetical protein [Solirubrobacteraceae bacterium]